MTGGSTDGTREKRILAWKIFRALHGYARASLELRQIEHLRKTVPEDKAGSPAISRQVQRMAREITHSLWLDSLRDAYENGAESALLEAVGYCAEKGIVMPPWVAGEYLRRYRKVERIQVKSLDEAFGAPIPKNAKRKAYQDRHLMAAAVYFEVIRRHRSKSAAIDEQLFDEVGESLGLTMSTTRRYFYWFKSSEAPIASAIRDHIEPFLDELALDADSETEQK